MLWLSRFTAGFTAVPAIALFSDVINQALLLQKRIERQADHMTHSNSHAIVPGPFFQPGYGLPVYRTTRPQDPRFCFSAARATVADNWSPTCHRAPPKNKRKKGAWVSRSINRQLLT